MKSSSPIIYTKTDEAPALATRAFLPMLEAFTRSCGIEISLADISLAGRILAQFPDLLPEGKQVPDELARLGEMVLKPEANIIKLPNISASLRQLQMAIRELQEKGYRLPDYPTEPSGPEEEEIGQRYDRVKGSAVNPVLRMGNSDRRAPKAVKEYARKHPHSMGQWSADSKSHVASMDEGDFYGSEKALTLPGERTVSIRLKRADGSFQMLKRGLNLQCGEIIDASVMKAKALRSFLEREIEEARQQGVLFSLHLKATMMKVSDPVIFGHGVSTFFAELFETYGSELESIGFSPDNGLGDLYSRLESLPSEKRKKIEKKIGTILEKRPELAMIDSDREISSLHVPSDIIIDASMPAAIRAGGKMWGPDGTMKDMKAVIPDRCYAGIYRETIDFCKSHGAFDPTIMGTVSNVGLMAEKAEEYGSHDKTFILSEPGIVEILDESGAILLDQMVEEGDIFRACQVKDGPIRDWVRLGVERARETGDPALFWLDENRAHDAQLIHKVNWYLRDHDTEGLDIRILPPSEAIRFTLERTIAGEDTISVTGNVLRDYLTDLFPIMELGTSAKMLSIVPLMAGGGLFETGAGGSAPKHVQQFLSEGHLRWDSLGEYLALTVSLEEYAKITGNEKAGVLAGALDRATGAFLENQKSPSRRCGELDNRGSHYYLCRYWARELAQQNESAELAKRFLPLAEELEKKEESIIRELNAAQGSAVDIGGYYFPDEEKVNRAMRPSETLNRIMDSFSQ
jgi:isocitrate dehydrogenase